MSSWNAAINNSPVGIAISDFEFSVKTNYIYNHWGMARNEFGVRHGDITL